MTLAVCWIPRFGGLNWLWTEGVAVTKPTLPPGLSWQCYGCKRFDGNSQPTPDGRSRTCVVWSYRCEGRTVGLCFQCAEKHRAESCEWPAHATGPVKVEKLEAPLPPRLVEWTDEDWVTKRAAGACDRFRSTDPDDPFCTRCHRGKQYHDPLLTDIVPEEPAQEEVPEVEELPVFEAKRYRQPKEGPLQRGLFA
jgi:hypothetical protein